MTQNEGYVTNEEESTHESIENNVTIHKRKARKLPKCIRPEEFIALIKQTPKGSYRIAFLLGYASGMRLSEVLRCSPEHLRDNSIFIPESKYGVERVVPLPKGWKPEHTKLLPLKVIRRTLQRRFKTYCKLANLDPKYSFHSLRHGFATRSIEAGIPPNQVQLLLGHSNIATTSIYTKANPIDAIRRYEELF